MSPFDPRTILFAKHAQHVALIHFPIALFVVGVVFDFLAQNVKRANLALVAYYNFLGAAISALPVIATGILAWQLQFEGQKPNGVLLMHLIFGWFSGILIFVVWYWHFRARRRLEPSRPVARLALEALALGIIMPTGHLGRFLSGPN
ncbi:MAG TPA: DUF2231 domain-containing protein [Candidatus Methylomirabilis sp.]|nr:DUF2231 domain-containing protein [Candidatus Methylomirabilis sp.]